MTIVLKVQKYMFTVNFFSHLNMTCSALPGWQTQCLLVEEQQRAVYRHSIATSSVLFQKPPQNPEQYAYKPNFFTDTLQIFQG